LIDLRGKVAVVTGASRGIGAAIAKALGVAGASVVLGSEPRDEMVKAAGEVADQIQAAGADAQVVPADVTDEASTEAMLGRATEAYGRLDVFVANAARLRRVRYTELSRVEWERALAVNATGVFIGARAAAERMTEGASIITVGSVAFQLGRYGSVPYIASKGAVVGITRALAGELGPRGIRVNCVVPGAIRTESERELPGGVDDARVIEQQFLPRRGEPEDVANAVIFLASPLSDFVTGQLLNVDGGWVV
jgi:3-oxoacyl-[acyl-carrier protein] reductase